MESVIGEYSSYQAALRAHNLEGHVIAVWANTHGTENAAFSLLTGVWLRCRILCLRTSNGADVTIFRDGRFREKQKDGDGPAEAAPGDAGIVSVGQTLHYCHSQRLHNSEVCFKPADGDGTTCSFSAAAKTKVAAALTSIHTKTTDYLIAADTGCLSGATNMIRWGRDGVNQPCAVLIRGAGM